MQCQTVHFYRYDPPSTLESGSSTIVAKSLAEEIKEEVAKNDNVSEISDGKPEPPPDLLVSSNCRRKIWPQFEFSENFRQSSLNSTTNGMINDGFTEDWDMILDTDTCPVQENISTSPQQEDIILHSVWFYKEHSIRNPTEIF